MAARTYLLENGDDGLRDPWTGRVWLNPPYGRAAEPFLSRLADHGNGTALIFASVETRVFRTLVWERATAILFLAGRLAFLDEHGQPARTNAGKGSCLVAYGRGDARALRESGIPGRLVEPEWTTRTGDTPEVGAWLRSLPLAI